MDCGNWLSTAKEGIVKLAGFPWTRVSHHPPGSARAGASIAGA